MSFFLIIAQVIIVTTGTAMAKKPQTISPEQAKELIQKGVKIKNDEHEGVSWIKSKNAQSLFASSFR